MFIPELAGKGLNAWLIIKFLSYVMPTMVPLILPLSILLASIMTFGSFAENYEFAAMKSAGMSLGRAARGLVVFVMFLSITSFFFANDVIPYSKYKVRNFRSNLRDKPSMAIVEGQFNDIGNYNIKVRKKHGENDQYLDEVVIHKKSANGKNTTVTKAKRGQLINKEDSDILQLVLYDGHHYEELTPKNHKERNRQPFTKADFERYVINMDVSGLVNIDLDSENDENMDGLLNVSELRYTIDSLKTEFYNEQKSIADNIMFRTASIIQHRQDIRQIGKIKDINQNQTEVEAEEKLVFEEKNPILIVPEKQRQRVYQTAYQNLLSSKYSVIEGKNSLDFKSQNINVHIYSLYEKFIIAYSCLLMFFIGAPLGAIIRKGGFGMPIVFSIIIFITYHFSTTFGRKIAQDGAIDVFIGSWGSSIILTPLAIILTYRATNDKGMSFDRFAEPFQRFFRKFYKFKPKNSIENA